MMNIVLHEPEIPQNAGNIARTCAATDTKLHLIRPLGFDLADKNLKRAGLDYWHLLDIKIYDDFADFLEKNIPTEIYFISTRGGKMYTEVGYSNKVYLVFGSETRGLPQEILSRFERDVLRIPILEGARSLNLSISAAVVLYEALRQNDFPNLKR